MSKLLVVAIAMVGLLCLINMFVPQAWFAGFTIPIGKGIHCPWALPLVGGFFYICWGLKSK